jgi:general secretion pathway protein G
MAKSLKTGRSCGFTLIEMMIVMIIMGILLSIAIPIYSRSITRARESVLRSDLAELNKLVQQYTLDKQKAPQTLDDLVSAGYIKQVPKDPMTGGTDWDAPQCDVLESVDQQDPGICEVHSSSTAMSTEGTAYNTWN